MKVGYKQLIEEAEKQIQRVSVDEAAAMLNDDAVTFIDIRDVREVLREGKIPDAVHAPRGMLEFWVDPDSPYHRELFAEDKKFVFYCASAWRSALATQTVQQMGMENVCHMSGGFTAWKEAKLPIEPVEKKV
jgi:rhodanese-related sulfurtransferase